MNVKMKKMLSFMLVTSFTFSFVAFNSNMIFGEESENIVIDKNKSDIGISVDGQLLDLDLVDGEVFYYKNELMVPFGAIFQNFDGYLDTSFLNEGELSFADNTNFGHYYKIDVNYTDKDIHVQYLDYTGEEYESGWRDLVVGRQFPRK